MQLYNELTNIRVKYPFVFEIYANDGRDGLSEFISGVKNNQDIYILFDAKKQYSLIQTILQELYHFYKQEAPDIKDNLKKIALGTTKISLFLTGKLLTGGMVYLLAPWVGSLLTVYQWKNKNEDKEFKQKLALRALSKFNEEKKNINELDTLILSLIRLTFALNYSKRIIIHIKNPEFLNSIDLQFLITYYSLFKDRFSRISISQEMGELYKNNHTEAISPLLTILDWGTLNHSDNLLYSYINDKDENVEFQMKIWRWFLRRYKMVDDLHIRHVPDIENNDVFIGRTEILSSLKNDFNLSKVKNQPMLHLISGNSGMGKSTIASQFVNEILAEDTYLQSVIININYSNETVGVRKGLTEIRNAINKLKVKLLPNFTKRINGILNGNEKIKDKTSSLKNLLNVSSDIESILTPILNIKGASLGGIGEVISAISAAKDTFELKDSLNETKYNINKLNLVNKETIHSIQEVIHTLVTECILLLEKIKGNNQHLTWIIDDFQWMDEDSAAFFNQLISQIKKMELPIFFLFFERPSDSKSRINSSETLVNFQQLHDQLGQVITDLEGFKSEDITKYLIAVMKNENQKDLSIQVSDTLAEWFQINEGKKLEPLFLKETINLFYNNFDMSKSLLVSDTNNNNWKWSKSNNTMLTDLVKQNLNDWYRSNENVRDISNKFTPTVQAVLEERIHRLARHFGEETGNMLIQVLEAGAFIGEPLHLSLILKYLYGDNNLKIDQITLDEVEFTYKLLVTYFSKTITKYQFYLYTHSIYKEFLGMKFYLGLPSTSIEKEHIKTFEIIDEQINNIAKEKIIDEDILLSLIRAAVKHGSYSDNKNIIEKVLKYYLTLIDYETDQLKFHSALQLTKKGLKLSEEFFGYSYLITLQLLCKKATIEHEIGTYNSSIDSLKKALLYTTNPNWFEYEFAINNLLGLNYRHIGDYRNAEKYYQLASDMKISNVDYQLALLNNIAVLNKNMGLFSKARDNYLEILNIINDVDNGDYLSYKANVLYNFGALHEEIGEWIKGVPYYEEAINIYNKLYGTDHPISAKALNSFGVLHLNINIEKAKKMILESTETLENLLMSSHPEVALAYNNKASLFFKINMEDKRIEEYAKKSLKIYYQLYGLNNIYVLSVLDNLSVFNCSLKKYRKAEKILKYSLALKEDLLGKTNPKVASSLCSLGMLYMEQEKVDQAYPLLLRALEINKLNGLQNDSIFKIIDAIINMLKKLKDDNSLIDFISKELSPLFVNKKAFPHRKYVEYLDILIRLHNKKKNFKSANKYYPRLIKNQKIIFGKNSVNVAVSIDGYAYSYAKLGRLDLAEKYLDEALRIFEKHHSLTEKENINTCISNMIKVLQIQERPDKLIRFIKRVERRLGSLLN